MKVLGIIFPFGLTGYFEKLTIIQNLDAGGVVVIYTGNATREISFPLGGIGSGCIGLGGDGRLIDWEIFNHPSKGSRNGYSHLAIKAKNANGISTRVLNGDIQKDLVGPYLGAQFRGYGYGPECGTLCGFPHFKDVTFQGEFPLATLQFNDESFPAVVRLKAFNPFIPLDDRNSSIPAAFFEVEIENSSSEPTEFQAAFSVQNPFPVSVNTFSTENGIQSITLKHAGVDTESVEYGDLTLASDCPDSLHQTYWYRGRWQDAIVSFWNDFNAEADLKDRMYTEPGQNDGCTLVAKVFANPGETKSVRFVLSWNVPNCCNDWSPYLDEQGKNQTWKNYYATVFENSAASAAYSLQNWDSLYGRTLAFKEALYGSTLDPVVLEAVCANLSVLKSPTVLRLEDGSFYGWEGVHQNSGSCEGTCQHVWNYAYALCFLFPQLERSIRNAELNYALLESGQTVFRLKLPYGRDPGTFRACVDGQMGTIIKMYREWKISGDSDWLRSCWPKLKKMLAYAWSDENPDEWDRDRDGVLEGRQHHTLDMELFGPSSWLEGMYLAALKAAAEMAEALGEQDQAAEYREIFEKGRAWTKENLFNGCYFIQRVDIKDKEILTHFGAESEYWNDEQGEIKYQIATGSEIDQILAQWHAHLVGLGNIFDPDQVKTTLKNMMKYNFKPSMRDFTNPWRIFSVNDEAGTVICDYPDPASKPGIPIPYCEETMTGFEYQFAGLLIANGMIEDGVRVVRAIRDRYDGAKRNPWNEIECGSNYARSMASFALLPIWSGFEFDQPHHHVGFHPVTDAESFASFWSLDGAWGRFERKDGKTRLVVLEGSLPLASFGVDQADRVRHMEIDGQAVDFTCDGSVLRFEQTEITHCLELS